MWQRPRYELNKQRKFRQVCGDKHANKSREGERKCDCVGDAKEEGEGEKEREVLYFSFFHGFNEN